MESKINRRTIFGTNMSCVNLEKSVKYLTSPKCKIKGYLTFPSSDIIARAYKNEKLRSILNNSILTFTDGKITEFYFRMKGEKNIRNVSGFDLLERLLNTEKTHYFYGLNNEQLKLLKDNIETQHPYSNVLGYKSPPFVKLDEIKENLQIRRDIKEINKLKPDFIWIGISSPKQDYLMKHFVDDLDQGIMVGVGAVLLYKAGIINKGPQWIKDIGMRWLVRLIQEPKRVWEKGTLQHVAFFIFLIIKHDLLRVSIEKE